MQTYATPGAPHQGITRPIHDRLLSPDEQREFRSGVGMLLYLVKHSRPDIANATRELAKVMDGATKGQLKELHRAIKFVLDTADQGLKMKPRQQTGLESPWELNAYCDSDYSGDVDTRRSVTGFIVYVMDCPISWKSKSQRSVTLSSTEAEYVAISEVCAAIMFIKQIVEFVGVSVKKPIIINVDNVGAIYLANSATTSNRTKHVDTRYHFVREHVVDGIVEIVFVKSANNTADVFTKNVSGDLFAKHTAKMVEKTGNHE